METPLKYCPIEVTTHNIYFHEDSPILSTDFYDDQIATCGYDNTVRFWNVNMSKMKTKESSYKTAANSSISLEFNKEFKGFKKPINCIRFYKGVFLETPGMFLLAACSDDGKVMVFSDDTAYTVRAEDGDDAYDLAWTDDGLAVGFSSGKVEIYKIRIKKNKNEDGVPENTVNSNIKSLFEMSFELKISQKIHDGVIRGISSCKNLVATHSLDKTVKMHLIDGSKLVPVSSFGCNIDTSRGFFKRILLTERLLYIFTKNNSVSIYSYPFREIHLHKKIGPLNSPIVKIVEKEELLYVCTKKSIYVLENDKTICCVDNCCYMAVTDGFSYNKYIFFLSSMDGFISSVRLSEPES